eukprot:PLAT5888.1.p1 GENE.PLAT5888.1~~PLAT5888.1.p1  ORF type:complete len:509 (-),score=219.31 PLAT5888.1:108-1634(-)
MSGEVDYDATYGSKRDDGALEGKLDVDMAASSKEDDAYYRSYDRSEEGKHSDILGLAGEEQDYAYGVYDDGPRMHGGRGGGGGSGIAGSGMDGAREVEELLEGEEEGEEGVSHISLLWSRPVVNGPPPRARGGHSTTLAGSAVVVFGGHFFEGGTKFSYLNDTVVLDINEMAWLRPKARGSAPEPRYGHSATLVERELPSGDVDAKLFFFGGRGRGGKLFNDIHTLDVNTWRWRRVQVSTVGPPPRFNHSELLVGSKIVIFGGWDGRSAFNDFWVFDTEHNTWIKPRTAGVAPRARHGASMCLTEDGRVLVFGGYAFGDGDRPVYLGDVRELDTETMVWSRPRVTGDYPTPRYGHTSAMVDRLMVVFGGWMGVRKCILCNVAKSSSGTRIEHAPDCIIGKSLLHSDADDAPPLQVDYLNVLDTHTMEWSNPTFEGAPPGNRYGHTVTPVGTHLLVFGGWDGNRALNELWDLQFVEVPVGGEEDGGGRAAAAGAGDGGRPMEVEEELLY